MKFTSTHITSKYYPFELGLEEQKGKTGLLMDYGYLPVGMQLNKYEWDLMHDPGIVTGLFQSDTSGQQVGDIATLLTNGYKYNPNLKNNKLYTLETDTDDNLWVTNIPFIGKVKFEEFQCKDMQDLNTLLSLINDKIIKELNLLDAPNIGFQQPTIENKNHILSYNYEDKIIWIPTKIITTSTKIKVGQINELLMTKSNFQNAFYHEYLHYLEMNKNEVPNRCDSGLDHKNMEIFVQYGENIFHAQVVLNQMLHPTFYNTTKEFQENCLVLLQFYLCDSDNADNLSRLYERKGISFDVLEKLIECFKEKLSNIKSPYFKTIRIYFTNGSGQSTYDIDKTITGIYLNKEIK